AWAERARVWPYAGGAEAAVDGEGDWSGPGVRAVDGVRGQKHLCLGLVPLELAFGDNLLAEHHATRTRGVVQFTGCGVQRVCGCYEIVGGVVRRVVGAAVTLSGSGRGVRCR